MQELPPEAKLPVDLSADDAKKFLVKTQRVLKPGCLAVGNIDIEKQHCKEIAIRDRVPLGSLRPRFDFDYVLKDMGKYNAMSWKDTTISYEEAVMFYTLVLLIKPLTVFETGMGLALSTVHIAQALVDNQKGELFTLEQDSSFIQRGVSALNSFGFKEQVTVISQSSIRVLNEWVRPIDLAFLDTPSRQLEFDLLISKLKPGGIVVSRGPLHVPNDGAWNRLELPGMEGLYLYQKRANQAPDGQVLPADKEASKFKPEQVDWDDEVQEQSATAGGTTAGGTDTKSASVHAFKKRPKGGRK
jgi:tRNA A58 N-methylase Trm61